jgi:putative membrane protein
MDVPDYDDFEISIFKEQLNLDKTAIVDLHQEDMAGSEKQMYYNTCIAGKLRENLNDFVSELEKLEQQGYRAGSDVVKGENYIFSLSEEVGDQRTLIFGIEENGLTDNIRELELEFAEDFDEVLAFSTDSHSSIHELAIESEVKKTKIRRSVDKAVGNISDASIGLGRSKTDKMTLLQADYSGLIFSINIIIRLLPVTLILLYIVLIILVF